MMRAMFALLSVFLITATGFAQQETPKACDPRLVVELVASSPDIVHPVACDFDSKGRLLVIESHTHFAPQGYKGPKFDRILAIDPRLAPGADKRITTFFEGTRHSMDLAVHSDGSVYLATRNEILRLRETKGGVKSERIVFMETKGDYPHNGLSGLCFDSKGDLTFGMGENLGVVFKLIGSDGRTITDEQGGHIFHCSADGKNLRRIATGFWNPFGICRDIYGRTFAVDNDPDQAPPCRMLHVVEGGDYGFRFCYGRSGKHPFQSWHGTLPGTLPMMTGVGEAPCEILSYESDGLPKEYLGKLMVTSWADHRVELYKVVPHGASFKAERQPFVQGGNNFRPTGMCVAPDGSLFVADWVKSDYTLHGKGAIWHIRWKDAPTSRERKRPDDPRKAILSMHWPLREAAAKKLAGDERDGKFLRKQLKHDNARVRAAALTALIDDERPLHPKERSLDAKSIARNDKEVGIREMAVCELVRRDGAFEFLDAKTAAALRFNAIMGSSSFPSPIPYRRLLTDNDPFIFHATVLQLADTDGILRLQRDLRLHKDKSPPRERLGGQLAHRILTRTFRGGGDEFEFGIDDPDETNRFLAVKWIADHKLADYREHIEKLMTDPKLSVRMHIACATALARIDGKNVDERSLADYFANRLADDATPPAQRAMLLRQVPTSHKLLTIPLLQKLGDSKDPALRREAIRALVDHPSTLRHVPLIDIVASPSYDMHLRAYAMLGLVEMPDEKLAGYLKRLVGDGKSLSQILAWRKLDDKRDVEKDRPPLKDVDAWLKRLDGKADPEAGERVFFHTKLAQCSRCHRIDGRGQDVGPDLSNIGNTDRRHILESILQPSNNVAPHYVAWHLETAAGKVKNGMLLHTHLDEYTYLDAKGDRFKLKTGDLVEQRPTTISIMPDGLIDRLTDQEVRDLLAYLQARK